MDKFLIVSELSHLLPAVLISFFGYRKFRSLKLVGIVFAASFLIDLDHLFDFYLFAGHLRFWQAFSGLDFFSGSQKVFVLFHGWELAVFLGFWGWLKRKPIILVIGLAFLGHILIDQLTYTPHPLAYFLTYRLLNNFSMASFN